MNPCIDCSLDKQGCHESGFAAAKCPYWSAWVTELALFKAECKQRTREARRAELARVSPFFILPVA